MRSKILIALLLLALLAVAASEMFTCSRGRHMTTEERMNRVHVKKYLRSPAGIMADFEYPEGWVLHEEQGQVERYKQVRIVGVRNRENSYSCYFSVQEFPLKSYGGMYQSADELLHRYTDHLPEGAKTTVNPITLSGLRAMDIRAEYLSPPWRHQGLKAIEVPIKTRVVILGKDPYFYQISYSVDAREYDLYADAFDHLLRTFRIR